MIVAETATHYQFVTQPDHATLAGQFADHWGNDAFESLDPRSAMHLAAYHHDLGWSRYDRRPRLDEAGAPIDFRDVPAGAWTALYESGIDDVVAMNAYAGLLVSLHGAGLRRKRYGLSPSWPETPPEFRAFVEREEDRQRTLVETLRDTGDRVSRSDEAALQALHESGGPPDRDSRLWHNYKLLQAWDALSLGFCVTTSPPGIPELDAVSTALDDEDATLTVSRRSAGRFAIDPYPFDVDPLAVSVPFRTVAKDAFETEAGALRAYFDATRETLDLTLTR
jgi:hypothetical protein